MRKQLNVAIIGIGPSGLAAALAVENNGGKARLFSKNLAKSPLYGCQYLHAPLPGFLDVPRTTIKYETRGEPDAYRRKVYGGSWDGQVSPEEYAGDHEAWDLRETYRLLYRHFIEVDRLAFTPLSVSPARLSEAADWLRTEFDLIISTAPTTALCGRPEEHTFNSQQIYAAGDAPDRGLYCPIETPDDTIICNGEESPSWYRASRVFGYSTVEWPGRRQPPMENVVPVNKPLWTNCDCFPWIDRLGRFGSWRKDVLVHDVYDQMMFLYGMKAGRTSPKLRPRSDWCMRCGRIAYTRRTTIDPIATEYRCLSGHIWEIPQ
jgi:hypothetical protein